MRTSVLATASIAMLLASAAANTNTSFKLSVESWQRRCPLIETEEALYARGIALDTVRSRGVYARYDNKLVGGTVVLDLRIDTNGKVKDMQLVSSTSAALVGPVMRAVSEWRYKPLKLNGNEICVEKRLEMLVDSVHSPSSSAPWGGEMRKRSGDHAPLPPPPPPGSPR